ncbi:MAG TPA: single-stranded DNA-binding protein [Chloroflexia bacterium]|nr:single-stranded DNA-binding protein [Chloroflexia bacterium]
MAKGLNKAQLIGNLGKAPEMKYTANGKAVTTFSVAVDRPSRNGHAETDWFRVVAWEGLAEACNQYLEQGSKVFVEGRLQTRSWEGQDGQKHYATEVVAEDVIFLSGRPAAAEGEAPAEVATGEALPF